MTEPTAEERALYIGERLGFITEMYRYSNGTIEYNDNDGNFYTSTSSIKFFRWLSSPNGIHAVKQKMINRGYDVVVGYIKSDEKPYECCVYKDFYKDYDTPIFHCAMSEAEAVLEAAYEALKGEEVTKVTKA